MSGMHLVSPVMYRKIIRHRRDSTDPDSSEDSRFANIGNVREDQIIGKVWLRLFPLIRIGLIRS